ncbi:hypothetical protein [Bradyrhizobium sp. CCBAU 45384]|uniref:hypothetical protein n=1 Tax=Bradyrhizobium sp. CCBAU 45384 TaxID=858428 RepID=UPI0023055B15|nr:hypothetical protein [Bradyrhizobium sp. CCBAU 45384]MDA9405565.1 hypothetical protein [Bradyrhizobium sp. CCBAU 45384]
MQSRIINPLDASGKEVCHMTSATDWTTRVPPDITKRYGVEEVHTIVFTPEGWPGFGSLISLDIPECEVQNIIIKDPNSQPLIVINRPQTNRSVKYWLRSVCKLATGGNLGVILSCDTVEQAEHAAKLASRLLPNHERTALERVINGQSTARSKMS